MLVQLKKKNYKIWLAQWSSKITADFKPNYWQYTSKGKVNGITGNVDMNYAYDDISKTVENVNNSVEKSKILFTVGKTYTTQVDLNVRVGPGTKNRIKKYSELTEDGKKHSFKQQNAVLKKGTRITCLDVSIENNNCWIKIPSRLYCGVL